jgi:hypothetical protein
MENLKKININNNNSNTSNNNLGNADGVWEYVSYLVKRLHQVKIGEENHLQNAHPTT